MTLTPYPEYKDSGVDWLGDIPTHWRIEPLFGEYKEKQVKNTGLIENTVLSLSYGRIVVKPVEKLHGLVPASFETYQIVDPGDIIIRPTDLQNDHTSLRIGFSQHRGIITSAYMCLRTWNDLSPEYGYHVLNVFDLTKAIYGYGSGLRQNLSFDHIKRVGVPVPPPDEQAAIVRFLDAAEARIRRYIRARQKLIKLLNEQKQAIIQQAVTRGLDPDAPMKDSGIEWLGEIPAHWQTIKLKFLVSTLGGMTPSKSESNYWDGDIPWVSPKDMKVDVIKDSQDHITQLAVDETNISIVPSGSLLMVVRGMILARRVPVAVTACPVTINQDMKALVAKTGLRSDYLRLMFQGLSPVLLFFVEESGHGTRKFPTENWANLHLPIPNVDEQEIILEHIQNNTFELDEITKQNEAQIDLIREYRTRLIANVVTGKVDVRGLAFEMPEAFDERDLLDVDEDEVFEEDEFEGITDE